MATRWGGAPCGCQVTFDTFEGEEPINPIVEVDCGRHGKLAPAEHIKSVLAFSRAMGALETKAAD